MIWPLDSWYIWLFILPHCLLCHTDIRGSGMPKLPKLNLQNLCDNSRKNYVSQDIKILGWCPAGSVLPLWGEGASLALVGHPSIDGVTIKIDQPWPTLTNLISHLFLLGWLKLNPILLLDQLRLAQGNKHWW